MINGKQCTIVWYVDDVKISHQDEKVVKSIMKLINDRFPGITSKIGKEHEYLGMNIKFLCNGNVTIDMKSYVKETISASNMGICKNAASPAKGNLFEVDETSEPLNQERKEIFHHCVAKLLYVAK